MGSFFRALLASAALGAATGALWQQVTQEAPVLGAEVAGTGSSAERPPRAGEALPIEKALLQALPHQGAHRGPGTFCPPCSDFVLSSFSMVQQVPSNQVAQCSSHWVSLCSGGRISSCQTGAMCLPSWGGGAALDEGAGGSTSTGAPEETGVSQGSIPALSHKVEVMPKAVPAGQPSPALQHGGSAPLVASL